MQIGISCEFLGAKRNGTATYSRTLLRGLAELSGDNTYVPYLSTPDALALVTEAPHIRPRGCSCHVPSCSAGKCCSR